MTDHLVLIDEWAADNSLELVVALVQHKSCWRFDAHLYRDGGVLRPVKGVGVRLMDLTRFNHSIAKALQAAIHRDLLDLPASEAHSNADLDE